MTACNLWVLGLAYIQMPGAWKLQQVSDVLPKASGGPLCVIADFNKWSDPVGLLLCSQMAVQWYLG